MGFIYNQVSTVFLTTIINPFKAEYFLTYKFPRLIFFVKMYIYIYMTLLHHKIVFKYVIHNTMICFVIQSYILPVNSN